MKIYLKEVHYLGNPSKTLKEFKFCKIVLLPKTKHFLIDNNLAKKDIINFIRD